MGKSPLNYAFNSQFKMKVKYDEYLQINQQMRAIFIAKQDVFLDEIPEFYQESLKQFLFGCTCMVVDGRIKYYYNYLWC